MCEFCGKPFTKTRCNPKRFCSTGCQHEWQKTNIGAKNPRYTSVSHKCDYCGKEHIVKAYRANNENLFCSTECRQAWYANVWSQRDEWRYESSLRATKILSDGLVSSTQTKPQLVIDDMLDKLGIEYVREYQVMRYSIDNYLSEYGLCIEVMGDFWHTSPLKYEYPKYDKQTNALKRDILKRRCVREYTGCDILYLWESDINNNPDLCRELIRLYTSSGGNLQNYNSFNYSLNGSDVLLNKDIILAFQDYADPDLIRLPNA